MVKSSTLKRKLPILNIFALITLLCVLANSLSLTVSYAADANVRMTVRPLYEGNFKYGDWLPVEVTLENFGSATDVRVESLVTSTINSANFSTLFQRSISLGARSNKRFIFYIQPFVASNNVSRFVTYDQSVYLRVGDRTLSEQKIKLSPVSPTDYLVGVFAQDISQVSAVWNNIKIGALRSRVTPVTLTSADVPDRVEGLHSFDALIMSEFNSSNLNKTQVTAIKNWVANGGQLILMGGTGWNRVAGGFDSGFLPIDMYDFTTVDDLSGLVIPFDQATPLANQANMAVGQVLSGGQPVVMSKITSPKRPGAPVPLVAERVYGSGRVVVSAVDYMVSPTLEWSGGAKAWQNLFSYNAGAYYAIYSEANPHLKNNPEILSLLTTVNGLPMPDITPFIIIFGVYLLVVAPSNFLILRRLKKVTWAWTTIPLATVVFTGVTVWFALQQPPGDVLINQFSVVQTLSNGEVAHLRSYAAVFSPEERRYEVTPKLNQTLAPALIQPLNRAVTRPNELPRTVIQGDEARVSDFEIGEWAAQGFSFETTISDRNYRLQSNLSFRDNKIVGTLTNTTPFTIRGTLLALGDTVQKIKDLEPGETFNLDFTLPGASQYTPALCSTTFTGYNSGNSFESTGDRLRRTLLGNVRDDKNLTSQSIFLKKMYDIGRYGPKPLTRGFDLVGWLSQNPAPLNIPETKATTKSNQLLIARLPVSYQANGDNQLILPPGYLHPELVKDESGVASLSTVYERTDQICVNAKNSVSAMYRLPTQQGPVKPKTLTLYFNSVTANSSRTPITPDQVEMYDWQDNKWRTAFTNPTNSATGTNSNNNAMGTAQPNLVVDPVRFVNNQTGQIFVRFSSYNYPLFIQFSLGVEGIR
jgi:hypothetical protein